MPSDRRTRPKTSRSITTAVAGVSFELAAGEARVATVEKKETIATRKAEFLHDLSGVRDVIARAYAVAAHAVEHDLARAAAASLAHPIQRPAPGVARCRRKSVHAHDEQRTSVVPASVDVEHEPVRVEQRLRDLWRSAGWPCQDMIEIDLIAADPAPPTFDNTLAALERAGAAADRVRTIFSVWSAAMNDQAFQAVEREMAPRLAAFADRIYQNVALFDRIAAVYDARDAAGLTAEQRRLAWLYHTTFVRAGARLDPASKARLSAINQRLATLFTTFSQHVLRDETSQRLVIRRQLLRLGLIRGARQDDS